MSRIVPAILVLGLLLLPACSDEDCVTGGDPNPTSWQDPFAQAQDIVFSSDLVELSEVEWGATEAVEITISNAGTFDLELESAALESWSSENWEIGASELPSALAPDESSTFELLFHNTLEQDSYAALVILSNDPDRERAAVGFIGRSTIQRPAAHLSPLVLDFGFQFAGQGTSAELLLSNEGASPFVIGEVSLDQAAATPEEEVYELLTSTTALEGLEVPAGESIPLQVSFLPQNSLASSAELSVSTDDPQHGTLSALVRGNGAGALGCTAPSITLDSPTAPFSHAVGQGLHLQVSATVSDAEQPPSDMLVELFIGEDLIEEESSGAGGQVFFDIDIDNYEVENVFNEFPQGLHTFRLKVTDACPRSSEVRFVGRIGSELDPNDNDGDGYSTNDGDCDDTEPDNFPGKLETIDGADNDCDNRVDDETAVWDDDCDGYCETPPCLGQGPAVHAADLCEGLADDAETEADCDDRTDDYDQDDRSDGTLRAPGLEEVADHQDQDCDGTVDEGTNYADDDGDGTTELAGDCDDTDSSSFPAAVEWCDGTDNDCDGAVDDDCLETLLAPRVVGDVLTDRFEIPLGDEVQATALVLSDDPDLTWAWSTDSGTIVSGADSPDITWQAPENSNENQELLGSFASLVVTVTDSRGRSDTAFGVIRIGEFSDGPSYSAVGGQVCSGCSALGSRPASRPLSLLLLLALAGELLRRRN